MSRDLPPISTHDGQGPQNRHENREGLKPLEGEVLPSVSAQTTRIKVKKYGFLGAFLRPIGIAVALLILGFGSLTIGTSYYRSYQRHVEYSKITHSDDSYMTVLIGMAGPALSTGQTKFIYRDINGKLHRAVAVKSALDEFINKTLVQLDHERDGILLGVKSDLDAVFKNAFADRDEVIKNYADWFFEWKRSYVILKEAIKSSATRFVQLGQYESLKEAVERDVKEYFLKNYSERVLKPEIRDKIIALQMEALVLRAHARYRQAIVRSDQKLQSFLSAHTKVLEEFPRDQKIIDLGLNWDAQKWKSPTYMVQDRAFDGVVGVGRVAAGGTFGALALGPLMTRTVAASFATLSRGVVTGMGSRIAFAEGGALAGTAAAPGVGTAIGTAAGLALGATADYYMNKQRAKKGRKDFVKTNGEALDLTISQWKNKLNGNVEGAVNRWFDDARAGVVLSRKKLPLSRSKAVLENTPML
ncbi:MAG: hypothetical protein GY927_07545 [bacterium]|nr:hypothetical protein [bacterium]